MSYVGGWSAEEFSKISKWTVWRFKTDLKVTCSATQTTPGRFKTWPIAVFYIQSTGDLRLDIGLDDNNNPRLFVPQGGDFDANDPNFRGYVKLPGEETFVPIDSHPLLKLDGAVIEVRPAGSYPSGISDRSIDLSGINKVVESLRSCVKLLIAAEK